MTYVDSYYANLQGKNSEHELSCKAVSRCLVCPHRALQPPSTTSMELRSSDGRGHEPVGASAAVKRRLRTAEALASQRRGEPLGGVASLGVRGGANGTHPVGAPRQSRRTAAVRSVRSRAVARRGARHLVSRQLPERGRRLKQRARRQSCAFGVRSRCSNAASLRRERSLPRWRSPQRPARGAQGARSNARWCRCRRGRAGAART